MLPLLLLAGCELSIEQYLRDVREPSEDMRWEGFIYQTGPLTGETVGVEVGQVTMTALDEDWSIEAEQPFDTYPSWWRFDEVPKNTEVVFRVEAVDQAPMIWRDRSPSGDSRWLDYGLMTMTTAEVDEYLTELSSFPGVLPASLSEGDVAHLWGSTWEPSDWTDADLEVINADGESTPVLALFTDEESGALTVSGPGDPVEVFYAFNLPAGWTSLIVTSCEGVQKQIDWPTESGDLLSALYTTLPEPQ